MCCCRYQLFNQRQINGAPHEWTKKLPDFVKRLEDALLRAAESQVSAQGRPAAPVWSST